MKKIFALVLAIALVLTSVVAFAEAVEAPKGTPNINSFAKMTVKYHELGWEPWGGNVYWEIKLSKPVDRLLVNWTGKGEEPEELAVDENLTATALRGSHKYMPGTTQSYNTSVSKNQKVTYDFEYELIGASEYVYKNTVVAGKDKAYKHIYEGPVVPLLNPDTADDEIAAYMTLIGDSNKKHYEIVEPVKVEDNVYIPGYIQLNYTTPKNFDTFSTVRATPYQTAFMTVQGDWAVYYSRSGRIVGIELFDGQF
jgi:hypothetical protein